MYVCVLCISVWVSAYLKNIFNVAKGRAEIQMHIPNLTGTYGYCQTGPPLQPLPDCGLLWGLGALAPPGYSDLSAAAHDPFPPAPLRCLALACLHQDFGGIERSAIRKKMLNTIMTERIWH